MFRFMDGSDPSYYCAGVEPSAIGNACLAQAVWSLINGSRGIANVNGNDDDNDNPDNVNEASALSEDDEN